MSQVRWFAAPLFVVIAPFSFIGSAHAVPISPSSSYGKVQIIDSPPVVGSQVDAWLAGSIAAHMTWSVP